MQQRLKLAAHGWRELVDCGLDFRHRAHWQKSTLEAVRVNRSNRTVWGHFILQSTGRGASPRRPRMARRAIPTKRPQCQSDGGPSGPAPPSDSERDEGVATPFEPAH
jgi:hypothetical protein